jgi:two-component system, response regulator PdtaR
MTRSILLVDPDLPHRLAIARDLDGTDLRLVAEAGNPEEAMRLAATSVPDVALIASFTNGDGAHLADRLFTEHGLPVVLLASASGSLPLAEAAPAGVMGLLVEPIVSSTLRATVEVAVRRHRENLALRREIETLQRALESRKVIERAKGLLMELDGIPESEAFVRIRQKSMDTQRPMADIARAIILAAELTGPGREACAGRK